jgi:hypothetical protein
MEHQAIACEDHGAFYRLQVTAAVAAALFDLRIFRGMSMPPGQEPAPVVFPKNARIEPYTAYLVRGPLATLGAFSYAHTVLPWNLVVGRYCSIAADLEMFGEQHPTDRATAFLKPEQFIGQIEDLVASGRLRPYRPPVLDAPALLAMLDQLRAGTWTPPPRPSRDDLLGPPNDAAAGAIR